MDLCLFCHHPNQQLLDIVQMTDTLSALSETHGQLFFSFYLYRDWGFDTVSALLHACNTNDTEQDSLKDHH